MTTLKIDGYKLNVDEVYRVSMGDVKVEIADSAKAAIHQSRKYIEDRVSSGETMYGVNTGFGAFSSVRISDLQIEQLQRNLIRSHSVGVGKPLSRAETRAIMLLRANALVRGHSGIRLSTIEKILEFLNQDLLPVIPSQGSVGASGDLAPLSHLALGLMGEGKMWVDDTNQKPTSELLKQKNIQPLTLKAKEGLSLINGCQVMTAIGLLNLYKAKRFLKLSDLAGAMTLEALKGSRSAFHPLISASRPHVGESTTAKNLRYILTEKSEISLSHLNCDKVQDAYSLRCMPAVHGASKDAFNYIIKTLETEANSSTDNPLVFAEENKVLSCGNFHGEPVAFALDFAAIAFSALSNMSECRISKLVNPAMSGLPAFLAPDGGLNSGHMIIQVAAASLVSENKILAHPASVDSIPTSADKEDHVSMGTIAARKFSTILANCENILSMEYLANSQALDFLRPLKSSPLIEEVHGLIRQRVPFAKEDRIFSDDLAEIRTIIFSEKLDNILKQLEV